MHRTTVPYDARSSVQEGFRGTQVIDLTWCALTSFMPAGFRSKIGSGNSDQENEDLRLIVVQT